MSLVGLLSQHDIARQSVMPTDMSLEWCTQHLELFTDVTFTAKSTFKLECHCRKCFRRKKTPRKLKYKHKHLPKIHVWAGITKQGATHLVMFNGTMTAARHGD